MIKQKVAQVDNVSLYDYFLVFWLILLSGSPVIHLLPGTTYLTALMGIVYIILLKKVSYISKVLPSILFFVIISFGQYLTLGSLPLKYPFGMIAMLLAGAFIYYKLGTKFRYVYFNVIFFFSAASLIFWTLQNTIGLTFDVFNIPNVRNILIWSVRSDPYDLSILEYRNNGPFWEPGAFAGYILLVPILFLSDLEIVWKKDRLKLVIIIMALITTFSTTGYIIFFLVCMYKIVSNSKNGILKLVVVIPVILLLTSVFLTKIDFIGEKLVTQYEDAMGREGNTFSNTRMGAFYFDLQYIEKHPFFGNGIDPKTRWSDHTDLYLESINGKNLGHGNGFSNFAASMGLCSLFFLIINLFVAFKKTFKVEETLFVLLLFILLLQGESFLNYPLLFCLYFVKLPNLKYHA